ncbi:hypothetical protein [Undibacterium sp. Ren11W]|uniref:hypothetical protein n=1 Tax=Undibacterium sp. Ren11W TaxID=3413045 RepID=UPI003BF10601
MVTVKNLTKNKALLIGMGAVLSLAACGGFVYTTVGGNVTGLTKGSLLILQNEGNYTVNMVDSGPFNFKAASNAAYVISVRTQPNTDNCTVLNGKGQMTGDTPVTNIEVKCVPNVPISGSITGLVADTRLTLATKNAPVIDATILPVNQGVYTKSDGITLPYFMVSGYKYAVSVLYQPAAQVCSVQGGEGTADNANIAGMPKFAVSCVPAVTVGGTVTGLKAGLFLTLTNTANLNGVAATYTMSTFAATTAATAYVFNDSVLDNTSFDVKVTTQPVGQTCTVTNGSGVAKLPNSTTNIASTIAVNCI